MGHRDTLRLLPRDDHGQEGVKTVAAYNKNNPSVDEGLFLLPSTALLNGV